MPDFVDASNITFNKFTCPFVSTSFGKYITMLCDFAVIDGISILFSCLGRYRRVYGILVDLGFLWMLFWRWVFANVVSTQQSATPTQALTRSTPTPNPQEILLPFMQGRNPLIRLHISSVPKFKVDKQVSAHVSATESRQASPSAKQLMRQHDSDRQVSEERMRQAND